MPLAYIHFEPCPKCSEINHPKIHIAGTCKNGPMFRATCGTCHYEQQDAYESVKECSEAWNKESNEAWQYIANNDQPSRQKKYENKLLIQKLNELEQD